MMNDFAEWYQRNRDAIRKDVTTDDEDALMNWLQMAFTAGHRVKKADTTCLKCGGAGYVMQNQSGRGLFRITCQDCAGSGKKE